jgi:hypothetical protein
MGNTLKAADSFENWHSVMDFSSPMREESDPIPQGSKIKSGRKSNWKLPGDLTTTREFLAWVVLISSSVIYGGLHMLAWNASFQTKTEQILWRISAPTVMGYGVAIY